MSAVLVTSSLLIIVLITLRYLLRSRISPRVQYALWLLVVVRLLVPIFLPETGFSVLNFLPSQAQSVELQIPQYSEPNTTIYSENDIADTSAGRADDNLPESTPLDRIDREFFDLGAIMHTIWALGTAAMAVWFFTVNLLFSHRARTGAKRIEIEESPVPVYVSASLPSPCLLGLINQRIYITPACMENPAQLRHVLSHELTHYCQGDPWWSLIRAVCLCIYWFDPLVWWAAVLSRRDCELSCDAGTIRDLGEAERIAYGRTLVGLVAARTSPANLLQTSTAMYDGESGLKERIASIVKRPRMTMAAALCLLAAITVTSACTFTDAEPEQVDIVEISRQTDSQELIDSAASMDQTEAPSAPSEDDVLAARKLALERMSERETERLTLTMARVNIYLEQLYMNDNLFGNLADPQSLYWNRLHQTGEIQIGWAYDGETDMEAVCQRENLTAEEFYTKYGTPVMMENHYNADDFIALIQELKEPVHNQVLKADLQEIMDLTKLAKNTHVMEYVNSMYKKIHDLDYFLLRYGPTDVAPYVDDDSTVTKYYGTLSIYQ